MVQKASVITLFFLTDNFFHSKTTQVAPSSTRDFALISNINDGILRMTRWCPNLCTNPSTNSYWTMAAGKVPFVKTNSSSVSYFVVVSRLLHNTSPSFYLKKTCKGEIFHLPLRLSTLKFSCGPSTTFNIRRKDHWLLNNQPVGVLHSLKLKLKY